MQRRMALAASAIAAVLFALGLAACGGGDDDNGGSPASADRKSLRGQKVTFWIMNNGPHPVRDAERTVAPFERRTGVDVDVELVGWDVQFDRIRNAAVSGEGPDVTQAGTTHVPFFAALGGFEDLSERVAELGGERAYAPGVWGTTRVAGRPGTWAVPWFTEARTIYYRKDALRRAGVDPATAFTDLAALRSTLERLRAVEQIDGRPIMPFGMAGKKAFDLVHGVMPFVWGEHGAELTDDRRRSAIASPEAHRGLRYVADLFPARLADRSMLERDATQVENQYKAGRLAVWIGGPWVLGSIERSDDTHWVPAARKHTGVAPMPKGRDGKSHTFVGGSNLMLFKSSENKDAAWALIKFLSGDAVQKRYADVMGMFPSRLAPQKQVGATDANHRAFYQAIQSGRSYAPIPQWGQIENAYKTRFGNVLDMAAGQGSEPYSAAAVAKQLKAAAAEADGLLAQGPS